MGFFVLAQQSRLSRALDDFRLEALERPRVQLALGGIARDFKANQGGFGARPSRRRNSRASSRD